MTSAELELYMRLTGAISHHEQALEAAVKAKQQLARTLYERYGRHAVYRIRDGANQQDLMVSRTKTDTYYFAPRVRYPKESRYAKKERLRLDRAARLQSFPTRDSVALPTHAAIDAAAEHGRHDRDRSTPERAAQIAPFDPEAARLRLPIVGDVDQPPAPREPRLLDIQEPSGILLGDRD
jgi:hypothetical protein